MLPALQCASYYAQGSKNQIPYVYFDAGTYASGSYSFASPLTWNATTVIGQTSGVASVYANDVNKNGVYDMGIDDWVNPDSIQIIGAGLDEKYGTTATGRLYPTGLGYDPAGADEDNVANFCIKARLGDARP
jgi:hypothetical protein